MTNTSIVKYWEGFYDGMIQAVTDYAVWKDGAQLVGVMRKPLRIVIGEINDERAENLEGLIGLNENPQGEQS